MLSYLKNILWSEDDSLDVKNDDQIEKVGFQVMYVRPDSPSHLAGLIPVFDFIIAADDRIFFNKDDNSFVELIHSSAGKPITLQLYNSLSDSYRETTLVPGSAPDGSGAGFAGVVVRFSKFDNAPNLVWHVGTVQPGSPAQKAGLTEDTDYVVGCPKVVFTTEDDFSQYVAENINNPLTFFVWSTVTSSIRLVNVTPSLWGGIGLLGCGIMSGMLHRIPRVASLPTFALPPPDPNQQPQPQEQPQQPQPTNPTVAPAASTIPVPTVSQTAVPVPMPSIPIPKSPVSYSQRFIVPVPAAPVPEVNSAPTEPAAEPSAPAEVVVPQLASDVQEPDLSNSSAVLEPSD